MGLAIFEPNFAGQNDFFDLNEGYFSIMVCVESICLFLFLLELTMEIVHRRNDHHLNFKEKYIKNYKMLTKILINTLFVLDSIVFYSQLPYVEFRFSRFVRPFALALYQKQLRRTFTGILQSLREMVDVLLFFLLIILLYAVLGVRLIGNLQDETSDPLLNSFDDFGISLNNIYILLTRDNYPEVMLPSYHSSPFYLIYFIPFLLVAKLLLVPIPIAVMFEAFRTHRGKLVVKDRVKERQALFACFIALDFEYKSNIDFQTFLDFFKILYKSKKVVQSRVKELFDLLDTDSNGNLTLKEFFTIIETLESNKQIVVSEVPENRAWNFIRGTINKMFKFDQLAKSKLFEYFMLMVVLVNTVVLIAYAFIDNQDTLDTLDDIDNILVYIYLGEVIIKIIGMGILPYFTDGWNLFDFLLTVVSLTTTIALSFSKFTRTAKASRVLRNLRAQRALKLLRVIRGLKLCKVCIVSMASFRRVNFLFQNIGTCFPICNITYLFVILVVIKLGVILFMVTYSYAIIGMEVFPPEFQHSEHSHYGESYTDFDNIGGALLILFQIINEAKWAEIALQYAERFESVGRAAAYFDSYHALVNFIIISLLTGLILEVFTFMTQNQAEKAKLDELLDEINEMDAQIKIDINTQLNKSLGAKHLTLIKVEEDENESEEITVEKRRLARSYSCDHNQSKPQIGLPSLVQVGVPTTTNILSSLGQVPSLGLESPVQEPKNKLYQIKKEIFELNSLQIPEIPGLNNRISSVRAEKNEDYNANQKGFGDSVQEFMPNSNRISDERIIIPKNSMLESLNTDKFKLPVLGGDGEIENADNSDVKDDLSSVSESDLEGTIKLEPQMNIKTQILDTRRYSEIHGSNIKNQLAKINKKNNSEDSFLDEPYLKIEDLKVYKHNERHFYCKKITKFNFVSFERTQLAYLIDKEKEKESKKNDFIQEKLYLKLLEDDGEDDLVEKEKSANERLKIYQDSKDKILNKIEAKRRRLYSNTNTSDRLIRKALLRGADITSIEKYEDDQMRQIFGQRFETMRETNVRSMLKVFEVENHCTIRIMRLMKQSHIISNDFVKILQLIEESINKNLITEGSLGKFIFRDSLNRWFFFYQKGERMKIGYLEHGFWEHFSSVFPETNQLYEAQDIFHFGSKQKFLQIVQNMFISARRIAKGVQSTKFRNFDREENVWNAYMIPFETENSKVLRSSVLQNTQKSESTSITNLMKLLVTKGVFLSVNFESKLNTGGPAVSSKSKSPRRMISEVALSIFPDDNQIRNSLAQLERISPKKNQRSESMVNLKTENVRGRRLTKLDSKMLHGTHKSVEDVEEIIKGPQIMEYLPQNEYIDFLKDLRDILNYHKEYFLHKINLYYLSHPKNKKIDLEKV